MLTLKSYIEKNKQHGGALIDVLGAVAIAAIALILYKSTLPISDVEQSSQQVAWQYRNQIDAATKSVRANHSQLLTTLNVPDQIFLIDQSEFSRFLPSAIQVSPGEISNSSRPNAWMQKPCVFVRQTFSNNFMNQPVATGQLEVVLAYIGGNSPSQSVANVDLISALSLLENTGVKIGHTGGVGENSASKVDARSWFVPSTTWMTFAQSQAGQRCNSNISEWTHRIWGSWIVDASGQRMLNATNSEYLARYASPQSSWLQDMSAPIWLGSRSSSPSNAIASVHNLKGLEQRNNGETCDGNISEGLYALSKQTPSQLLQCKKISGVHQWLDASGILSSKTILSNTIVLARVEIENGDCINELIGTLVRNDSGAPMVCTGNSTARRWVRIGVPWAWVVDYKSLASNAKTYEFDPLINNIPVSAKMVQIYIEGNSPQGQTSIIKMEEIDSLTGNILSSAPILTVPAYSSGVSISGRPRLIDRQEGVKYRFSIDSPNASISIHLLGYSY